MNEQTPSACRVNADLSQQADTRTMTVMIEGATPESVSSPDAHDMAVKYAASVGFPGAGFNGMDNVMPIDGNGKVIEIPSRDTQVAGYRNELSLARL